MLKLDLQHYLHTNVKDIFILPTNINFIKNINLYNKLLFLNVNYKLIKNVTLQ